MSQEIAHSCVIERKQPQLPRFVVIPSRIVAAWHLPGTTAVEGKLNDTELGRRTIKSWDKDRWFIEIPETVCRRAQVDTGSRVVLTLRLASTDLPDELSGLLSSNSAARTVWDSLTKSQQRMLCENVASAKQSATRHRRAVQSLILRRKEGK
jgi:Bacteriocin-protection, YdeI or OmpD-Associated